jgi:hypothetical protein
MGEAIGIDSLLGGWAMPKAYSGEMRERVIAEVESGLDEVVLAMRKHKIPGGRTAVWCFFKRHKITFKKKNARSGARARGRGAGAPALDARTGHV